MVVFHWRSSSIESHFHWRLSSIKGSIPLEVFFIWRSSSIKINMLLKVIFHLKSSSIEGHFPLNVLFHLRSSFVKCHCLPFKGPSQRTKNILKLDYYLPRESKMKFIVEKSKNLFSGGKNLWKRIDRRNFEYNYFKG